MVMGDGALRNSTQSCECGTRRCPDMESRWFWPLFRARRRSIRRRNRCVDAADLVEMQAVRALWLFRTSTCPLGATVNAQHG